MKIAIDCHTLEIENWAGKEKFLVSLLEEFKKKERVDFILYFRKNVFKPDSFPANFTIVRKNWPTPIWQFFVIADLYSKKVQALLSPCAYLLPALNFVCDNFIVLHDLTTLLPETSKYHKFMTRAKEKLLLGSAIRRAKGVMAVSESTKTDCVKVFGTYPGKISLIPLAAGPGFRILDEPEKTRRIMAEYGLPQKFILFVGTVEPRKNLVNLIKAYDFLYIKNNGNLYKLVIVGQKGWLNTRLSEEFARSKCKNSIIFTGYLPDEVMPYLYNAAVCFVYPSLYEGFGLPLIEAMSCGCPVITSNISSMPEVVGNAAILVNPNDTDSIAKAIEDICSNEGLRLELSKKGLMRIKNYSWKITAEKHLSVIGRLRNRHQNESICL